MSTSLYLQDANKVIWAVSIADNGTITSALAPGNISIVPILKDYQTGLTAWQIGIDITGNLTLTNIVMLPSLTNSISLLSSPSNVLWSLVVTNFGSFQTFPSSAKTASYITTQAQSLLNDAIGDYWNFTLLLPFLQLAFQDLSQALELNQITITEEIEVILNLQPNVQVIGFGTIPSLPSNFIQPVFLWERLSGQINAYWIEMTQVDEPPNDIQTTLLGYWWWDGIQINLLGSTIAEDIKLKFQGGLYIPQITTDYIQPSGSELYLINRTAYYAADSIEWESKANSCAQRAEVALAKFLSIQIQGQASLPVRRRGYRRTARGFNFR